MIKKILILALLPGFLLALSSPSISGPGKEQEIGDATRIVKGALDYWRDTSSYAEIEMTIHRPDWERKSLMKSWTRGDKDALVRFVDPPKDAGSSTLKLGDDMWIFTPKLGRVIKLPFSMMAQSWMGSDFSYNDLAKSDELLLHFDNRIIGEEKHDGHKVYIIEAIPHANAPVIWGKQEVKIRDDHLLLEETFFDQDFKAVKRMKAVQIGPMGGKTYVTRMRMATLEEDEHWTEITYKEAEFGPDLPDTLFTVASLRNPRRQWEQR
jgi:outer membrane lipoprotein-sorting protein